MGDWLGGRTANQVGVDGRGLTSQWAGVGDRVLQGWCHRVGTLTLQPSDLRHPGHHLLPCHLRCDLGSLCFRLLKYEMVLIQEPTVSGYWEDKTSQYVQMQEQSSANGERSMSVSRGPHYCHRFRGQNWEAHVSSCPGTLLSVIHPSGPPTVDALQKPVGPNPMT